MNHVLVLLLPILYWVALALFTPALALPAFEALGNIPNLIILET